MVRVQDPVRGLESDRNIQEYTQYQSTASIGQCQGVSIRKSCHGGVTPRAAHSRRRAGEGIPTTSGTMEQTENQQSEPESAGEKPDVSSERRQGIRIEHLGGLGSLGAEIRPPLTSPGFKQNWGKLGPQA